jgi:hypothetical protein
MTIYNVTVKPEPSIAGEWIDWLRKEHIPDVMGTGCFTRAVILELEGTEESDGPTYAIQYHAENRENVDRYLNDFAAEMRSRSTSRWGDRFVAFRTIMKVIN